MSSVVGILFAVGVLLLWQAYTSPWQTPLTVAKWTVPKVGFGTKDLSAIWPDVVDDLASGVRAGLSLPQAVSDLSSNAPEILRPAFQRCATKYQSTGDFASALSALAEDLADPSADKFVSVLQVAYEVGGADLGILLRSLSEALRDELKVKGEIVARQSWTVNGARLAVAAPWLTVLVLSTRPDAASTYFSPSGIRMLLICGIVSVAAYLAMMRIGKLPAEQRLLV
jgi:tight adherence protein B